MLYLIVFWIVLTVIFLSIGIALLNWLKADCIERKGDRFILGIWLGIAVICFSLHVASIVLPVSPLVGGAIALSLVVIACLSPSTRTELAVLWSMLSAAKIILFLALACAIAAIMAQPIIWEDTGLYHYGSIRWIAQYGAVPGIALIHDRFGFTSSWFALAAPFNAPAFGFRGGTVMNGFVLTITCLHAIVCLFRAYCQRANLSDWFIIVWSLFVLPFLILSPIMSEILISPSPDIPLCFLTGIVAWSILLISARKKIQDSSLLGTEFIPLLLAITAFSIKLLAIPLLVVTSVSYLVRDRFSISKIIGKVAVIGTLILPTLVFGIITSGCPLYPSTFMCLNVPWLVSSEQAIKTAETTRGWSAWMGTRSPQENYFLWLIEKLWIWFSFSNLNQLMTILTITSLIGAWQIYKHLKKSQNFYFLELLAIGWIGIIFIFTQAPSGRFGMGYFVVINAVFLGQFCEKNLDSLNKNLRKILLFLILAGASCLLISSLKRAKITYLVFPPQLGVPQVTTAKINDVQYYYPVNYKSELCWAAELPCALGPLEYDIKLRNPEKGIQEGFIRDSAKRSAKGDRTSSRN
jgi:hypothetical protein